jgi:hypothetical protein
MTTSFEEQQGIIVPDVSKSKPLRSYQGQGDPMKSGMQALQKWQDHTTQISQLGGSASDGSTSMVVPQFDIFNPAGPDGPNGASASNNLTLFTNKQNSWQDGWANVEGEPAVMPPPSPHEVKYKGGRKKSKKRRSKKRQTIKRQTKKRRSKKRRSNKRKTRR